MAELTVHTQDGKVCTVALRGERVTLGRSSDNALPFPSDGGLSRFHLVIEPEGDRWVVADLGSKNGTYLNGVRLEQRRHLSPGDKITASRVELVFRTEEEHPSSVTFEAPVEPTVSVTLAAVLGRDKAAGPSAAETEAARALQALAGAARELAVRRPLAEMFRLVLQLSMEAIHADRGVLLVMEDGRLVVQASSGGDFRISTTVRERVLRRGESLLIEQLRGANAGISSESLVLQGIESVIAVPLQSENEILGMIYLDSCRIGAGFRREQLDLLTMMANLAGVSIERERWEQQRRDMLAENAATLGRLSAALSHEINSPLGTLKSSIQTLLSILKKQQAIPPELAELETSLQRTLESSLGRMSEVVGRIQRFTNLDRSESVVCNLNQVLQDVIELESSAGEPGVSVRFEPQDLPELLCRPLQLNTVFIGLLRHAVEAAAQGSRKEVIISTAAQEKAIKIRFAHSGAGIDPAQAFEPSFGVVGGRMEATNWSLFGARRIIREQGGDLVIERRAEEGTTFLATLPTG